MKKESKVRYIARLACFLALGVVLNILESLIPIPVAIPGIKLGLANTIGLIVLYFYSPKEYIAIGFLRVLFVGLLRTGIGSVAFLLSLSGWALSTLVTLLVYLTHSNSIYGLSIISGIFHGMGQLIMIMILYNQIAFISYMPFLVLSGLISGFLIGLLSSRICKALNPLLKK